MKVEMVKAPKVFKENDQRLEIDQAKIQATYSKGIQFKQTTYSQKQMKKLQEKQAKEDDRQFINWCRRKKVSRKAWRPLKDQGYRFFENPHAGPCIENERLWIIS